MSITSDKRRKIEETFEEGIKLRDLGNFEEAIQKFSEILLETKEYDAPVLGVMGNIYWNLKDYVHAHDCYQKAVELKPESELASLGLFHTLWDMGREREALAEAKRFLSLRESEEYFKLAEEMRDSFAEVDDIPKFDN
jgi:tetratricopeptide (TPR) repeat protein